MNAVKKILSAATVTVTTVAVTMLATVALLASPSTAVAATEAKMVMSPFKPQLKDLPSLQRGAKLFVNYCLSCHSAKFMRYNRMAEDLHIPLELVEKHMLFAADKIGDPMQTTMPADAAEEWFGVAPPDLSLIARLRGPEWLYNYLLTFYLDDNSPSGWNNVVFENVAMPHAMHELQGLQRAVFKTETAADGTTREVLDRFEIASPGKMSVAEYRQASADLTNFLVYLGEPAKLVRIDYGIWVLLFMFVFAGLAYLLKKEYWRDVE